MKKSIPFLVGLALQAICWLQPHTARSQTLTELSGDHFVSGNLTVSGAFEVASGSDSIVLISDTVDLQSSSLLFGVSNEAPLAPGLEWNYSEILNGSTSLFDYSQIEWRAQHEATRWVWSTVDGQGWVERMVLGEDGILTVGGNAVLTTANSSNFVSASSQAVAFGGAIPGGTGSLAFGDQAHAAWGGLAFGFSADANGSAAISMGYDSFASSNATSIGHISAATGDHSVALGTVSRAKGDRSMSMGFYTNVGGADSIGIGKFATTHSRDSVAIGQHVFAARPGQVVVGAYNTKVDVDTAPNGYNSVSDDDRVFVVGSGTDDSNRDDAFVVERDGDVRVFGDLRVGGEQVALQSDLVGLVTNSSLTATLGGYYTKSEADVQYLTEAGADSLYVSAVNQTVSIGAEDVQPTGVGIGEDARTGWGAVSIGPLAGKMGPGTVSGSYAVSIGREARAGGERAIGLGYATWAAGADSISLGTGSASRVSGAIAIGQGTDARQVGQVVVGTYNTRTAQSSSPDATDKVFIVGNGTGEAEALRSSALTVARSGDMAVLGSVSVGAENDPGATISATPDGISEIRGTLRVRPGGDISMGQFQAGGEP